jgi:hypothetical protein
LRCGLAAGFFAAVSFDGFLPAIGISIILLVDGRMVVMVSPQEGFLHQISELDTLGVDWPETKWKLH